MSLLANHKRIATIVRKTLARELGELEIVDVRVDEGVDSDGEEILDIAVIIEPSRQRGDEPRFSTAVRHIRPKLSEIGEYRFPMISFISRSDLGQAKLATG